MFFIEEYCANWRELDAEKSIISQVIRACNFVAGVDCTSMPAESEDQMFIRQLQFDHSLFVSYVMFLCWLYRELWSTARRYTAMQFTELGFFWLICANKYNQCWTLLFKNCLWLQRHNWEPSAILHQMTH